MSKLELHYEALLSFPVSKSSYYEWAHDQLVKLLGCVEAVEASFDIEFSCGDGKYFSDFSEYPKDDAEWTKYDGRVCLETPPRRGSDGDTLKKDKQYRFTVKYDPKHEEQIFYIDDKEINRKDVRR
jgi:hypothetical protein